MKQRMALSQPLVVLIGLMLSADIGHCEDPSPMPDENIYGIQPSTDEREHWSFQTVSAVELPQVNDTKGWIRNPIDAFILQKLNNKGITPSIAAEPQVWLRRVYFDLIGLPPSPEDLDEFLRDPSDESRARVVDRLLSSPGYGIRWGRRWLDVVRYADTNGYERDGDKPSAWRYRDYVIHSLNADKPYDQFLKEQIAGDEVPNVTADSMIGTTFLRLGTWDDEPADPLVDRYDQLDDVVRAVSTTFLGLTLSCARCHNHKFEPLSQIDYARMLAVFAPLERPQKDRTEFDRMVGTPSAIEQYDAARIRAEEATKIVRQHLDALRNAIQQRFFQTPSSILDERVLKAFSTPPEKRDGTQKKLVKENQDRFDQALLAIQTADETRQLERFQTALIALDGSFPTPLPKAYIFQESPSNGKKVQVFRRGDPTTPAGVVAPGVPVVLTKQSPLLNCTPSKLTNTSGRRLALAEWMIASDNPLVSRVIVNRIWQGHFGEGLVRTENDFGIMGFPPTHPELLDWLATKLMQSNWSLKSIQRMIVLSNTYAQSSRSRPEAAKLDFDNRLLWRFPYIRLDGEPVRDAILAVNGTLSSSMGGPGVYPKIAAEVLHGQSRPGNGWGTSSTEEASRRTVYVFVKRSLLLPFMELMDLPDTSSSCEQRNVSTIPTQALTLMNGEFLNAESEKLAQRVAAEAGPDSSARVNRLYRLALGRNPTSSELTAAVKFLEKDRTQADDARMKSLKSLCLVVYNLNEFCYID